MSKKKSKSKDAAAQANKAAAPTAKSSNKGVFIGIGVVLPVVIALVALGGNKGGKAGVATAEEQKYMGRFLPKSYNEPQVGTGAADATMVAVNATDDGQTLSLSVKDVADNKIVSFKYAGGPQGEIPMLAYVKPSGKLFVGVDYCPPCNGVGQTLVGGTLTCNTCGTKRDPESGAGISGTCKLYPIDEMPVKISGDKIVIDKADLDKYTPQPLDRPTNG